ncbi:MAG: hypothetical protein JW852_10775, partial [Spirochaetales bacterium]|nr:hypothetical protein [Spirochaetales bacterium]
MTGISDKGHAAPWVTGLAQLLKDRVDITIVSPAPQAPGTQTVEQDGIKYVFIKTRGPVANLLT